MQFAICSVSHTNRQARQGSGAVVDLGGRKFLNCRTGISGARFQTSLVTRWLSALIEIG